jgi:cytidylate kinase
MLRHWRILDSGALYRAFAFSAQKLGVLPDDLLGIQRILAETDFDFVVEKTGEVIILVNGNDVTTALRSPDAGLAASTYASQQSVRECLVARQRFERQAPGLVADGRDMGTVVFPDAPVKIFLTASVEERARRRQVELSDRLSEDLPLEVVQEQVARRDALDEEREVSPLMAAPDAVTVDTTLLDLEEVLSAIMKRIPRSWNRGPTGSTS